MKTTWYFDHQRRFKIFKNLENLTGECLQQIVTENSIIEEWCLYRKDEPSKPDLYKFSGNRINGCTHVDNPHGKHISITEIEASGLSAIRLEEY